MAIRFTRDQLGKLGGPAQTTTCKACTLTVRLQSYFSFKRKQNRWNGDNAVVGATVKLGGKLCVENKALRANYECEFPNGLPNGKIDFEVTPDPAQTSSGPAGPATAFGMGGYDKLPHRLYRGFKGTATVKNNKLVPTGEVSLSLGGQASGSASAHARVWDVESDRLTIDWRPDFIACKGQRARRDHPITLFVLHHTGGAELIIGSSLNDFDLWPPEGPRPEASTNKSPHYLLDTDGFLVRLVPDDMIAYHAGRAVFWKGVTDVDPEAIGIEIVHDGIVKDYTPAQVATLKSLLKQYSGDPARYPQMGRHRVVYHSDIRVGDDFVVTGKYDCPSARMPYSTFGKDIVTSTAASGGPEAKSRVAKRYSGFFDDPSKVIVKTPATDPKVVRELQRALAWIGYSVSTAFQRGKPDGEEWQNGQRLSGEYDTATSFAAGRFRLRFMGIQVTEKMLDAKAFDLASALVLEAALMDMGL